jgi:hypothetical protein
MQQLLRHISLSLTVLLAPGMLSAGVVPRHLRCQYQVNPLAIDTCRPRLDWILAGEPGERGQRQTAYQVLVAGSLDALRKDQGDLWDSGRAASDQSIQIVYAGKPLASRTQCHWKVRVWDQDGKPSPWSEPARWTTGLLRGEDWKGKWLSTSSRATDGLPIFRRNFRVAGPVRRATAYVCGLGFYELRLNGRKVGDRQLEPGWTNYRKTCLYSAYDVTDQIVQGQNGIGVLLGNGMYNVTGGRYVKFLGSFGPPKFILQLHLEYADGTLSLLASDGSWRCASGPVRFSCIYGGEDYDARKEIPGWDQGDFDDSAWQKVQVVDGPGGKLAVGEAPPIKVMQEFPTVKVSRPRPGVAVYDLGQNFSGRPRLTVRGPAGATVKMIPGELLDDEGLVSQRSSGGPVWFSYTLKGQGTEVWQPRFSYTGFRYVQVEGASPASAADAAGPRVVDLSGQFLHASAATVGSFSCSNPTVNRIHRLIDAAILSNLQSVLTDCPHREKLGWLEVSHLLAGGIMFNYDAAGFYHKITGDMREAHLENGMVPDIAPEYTVFGGGFRDSPEWGSAYVICPWWVYQMYGDTSLLADHYDGMKRYVAYLGGTSKDHIVSHGLGDWYDVGRDAPGESQLTSKGLTATAIYYYDLEILRQAAALLGRQDDAGRYDDLAKQVRAAFNQRFFRYGDGKYDRNSQTANAMPLVLGLADEGQRAALVENLVGNIRRHGNHVTAGDVGFVFLVRALTEAGRSDVLYDMVCQAKGPGYVDQLNQGATSLTEAWDANPASSQNHCMLGHAEEWFYRGLAGINPDPAAPGFKQIIFRPQVVGDLTSVEASYDSVHGRIESRWRRQGDRLTLDVTVPANTTALVYVPAKCTADVTEGGKPTRQAPCVKLLRLARRAAVYQVGSGSYSFGSRIPN